MSLHGSRSAAANERLPRNRTTRRESTGLEGNTNGNNSKGLGSYISNYTRSAEYSNRANSGRTPGGLRMKSNLVGSMTATFEQLKKDSLPPSGISSTKSSSSSKPEGVATSTVQKAASSTGVSPRIENGALNHVPKATETLKLENGSTGKKDEEVDNEAEQTPPRAKSSSSARRGKQQREKRMLRQKRRSTGVVKLKGSDDEDEKKKEGGNEEKSEEAIRTLETEKNTLSNELSPPPSANSMKTDRQRMEGYDATEGSSTAWRNRPSSHHSHQGSDSVFLSGDSTDMPMLNSSRRRGKRSTNEKSPQDSNNNQELCELREKLSAAEVTISKLGKEVEEMEADIKQLADENHKLKHENKLLEDENSSMLMVLKQLRSSRK